MRVNVVDKVLLSPAISRYQAKVVRIRQSHNLTFAQFVTSVRISLQFLKNWVEHEKKYHWAQRVPLKYPTLEFESICSPRLGVHNCQATKIVIKPGSQLSVL